MIEELEKCISELVSRISDSAGSSPTHLVDNVVKLSKALSILKSIPEPKPEHSTETDKSAEAQKAFNILYEYIKSSGTYNVTHQKQVLTSMQGVGRYLSDYSRL